MDIKKFSVSPTTTLHLRDAQDELMYAENEDGSKDESKPMRVTLYGPASKEYQRASQKQSNRLIDRLKKKGKADMTPEARLEEQSTFLAEVTAGFENVEYGEAKGIELARAIYSDPEIGFIADQVAKHVAEWSNFTRASSRS